MQQFYHAEGQKIAKKLSTQISKETLKIKALAQEYNACQSVTGHTNGLAIADALDSSTLAKILQPKLCEVTPHRQELINAYIMLKRSSEEIQMLKSDMTHTVQYYENRKAVIMNAITSIGQEHAYDRGARALLLSFQQATDLQVDKCKQLFSACLHQTQESFVDEDSDSADSYSDTDDEAI